jgi:hypothetical protein
LAREFEAKKLEVFVVQGHLPDEAVDYKSVFQYLETLPATQRSSRLGGKLVALRNFELKGNRVRIVAYEGPIGQNPLIYNDATAEERVEQLRHDEVIATKTHALLDLPSRTMVVEYNQRGAKAREIIGLCRELARRRWDALDLSLVPVVEASFVEALDRFRIIKTASVRIARPNQDWTNDLDNLMAQMAADSNARSSEVTLSAPRNGSLSRIRGLIAYLKEMVLGQAVSVQAAKITGIREGESENTSISLNNYVQKQVVNIPRDVTGHADEEAVEVKIAEFLSNQKGPPS